MMKILKLYFIINKSITIQGCSTVNRLIIGFWDIFSNTKLIIFYGSMIFTIGRCSVKLSLMSNSCTGHPTSIDHPLEALIRSSFVRVLPHVESSRWLIQSFLWISQTPLDQKTKIYKEVVVQEIE